MSKGIVMFKINDYVVYSSSGVYKIVDITIEKDINDNDTEYYVLRPAFDKNLTIKTPVNNPKVLIRGIMKKDDVLSLIENMPEVETTWVEDNRERSERFKAALRTGEGEEWIKLIKTIYLEKREKTDHGKKLMKTDEQIMKAAEKILYEEFAIALDISPEEVISYINDHVKG